MKIVCDSCATKYSISDDKVRGKVFKIRCKKCSHIIVVRGTADASAPAPTSAAPDGGGWHLVVDGEQVGPLPETDIRGRISRGEINAETYIWKEGFADWLKLSAVPEFADSVSATGGGVPNGTSTGNSDPFAESQPVSMRSGSVVDEAFGQPASSSGRNGGLFASVDAAAAAPRAVSGSADISDAFGAPPASARGGGGGDLFAAHVAAPMPAEDSRRGSGGPAHHDGGRVENLTGQRHENSVLFSLANLQSLAMPSAAPKASASSSGGGGGGGGAATSSATSDGSGLIDIRAMAATAMPSLGETKNGNNGGGGFNDDLPAFGSFSAASPVLFPVAQSSGPPKWLYPLIGFMVILLIGIGVMAFKILTTKPVTVMVPPPPAPVAPQVAAPAPAAPAPTAAAAPAAAPSTIAEKDLPPREGDAKPAAEAKHDHDKGDKSAEKSGRHGKGKDKDKKGGAAVADSGGGKASGGASSPAPSPAPEEKKPAKGSLDDLLAGALNNKPKKQRQDDDDSGPKKGGGGSSESASAGPLAKGAVVAGMNAVRPKVNDCYTQFKVPGMAMVNVVIGKNGKVSSATVSGKFAGTPTGSCVEKAVKSASFPPSDGLTTPYPFNLR